MTDKAPEVSPESIEDTEVKFIECEVLGRKITLKRPTPLQVTLLGRAVDRGQRMITSAQGRDLTEDEGWAVLRSMGATLDVLEALVVSPADQMWLNDQLIGGQIAGVNDLMPLLNAIESMVKDEKPTNRAARRRTK